MSDIRVLIVEDEPIVARSLRRMLEVLEFNVTATVSDKASALFELEHNRPDIALLDINLGGMFSGLEIGKAIHEQYDIPFVYLTAHADRNTIAQAKMTEPAGYIVKPFDEADILACVEIALYNHAQKQKLRFLEPNWDLINERLEEPLSKREMDVLKLIFEGRTNTQMAAELFISVNTIKSHLLNLYQKLGATSRTEAITRVRHLFAQ